MSAFVNIEPGLGAMEAEGGRAHRFEFGYPAPALISLMAMEIWSLKGESG